MSEFTSTDHVHCLDCGAAVEVETQLDPELGYVVARYPGPHICALAALQEPKP